MTWQEKGIGAVRWHHATLPMMVAELEGILLDPVYSGKGMAGLADLRAKAN